jgi:CubicO group peptidase (beta-lactamase class C family)
VAGAVSAARRAGLGAAFDRAELDRVLDAAAAAGEFSGIVRVTHAGDVVYEATRGMANRADAVPVTPATRFGVASVTKMFTAAAVGRLVDRGVLRFDDPLAERLPADQLPAAAGRAVTLHHLLSHTSGLRDYHAEVGPGGGDAAADVWRQAASYAMRRPADFLPLFSQLPARAAPGPPAVYTDAGFILLGLVLEHATGMAYADVIRREVLEPAGMADSDLFALDEVHPRVAVGYVPPARGRGWTTNVYSIPAMSSPDGGAFCTAADVCRFLDAFHAGALVSQATTERMLHPHAQLVADGVDYGYGMVLVERDGLKLAGHSGEDPGVAARAFRADAHDLDLVIIANVSAGTGPVLRHATRLAAAALAAGGYAPTGSG